ncbi:hypothetical protein CLV24_10518 [Pontibacter ummariensis]|uniref:Uncharacterized protein n=1 Tax=Pontibacter ummariensis TaxID=1610492 RepID=A0A239E130_9BACT|nr:hypothetical protein [Pontibacter ummariensis]PRY13648.1 hypothetical protein CLV24_10518 [Pontibacter ummariensis]SNS38396.1 hypothetical protein SAMN06296052_105233 [Pontibacter ummariensis]
MYVNLFPRKQLRATKKSVLVLGLFLGVGGAYAVLRELLWQTAFRPYWAMASVLIVLIGLLCLAVATDFIRLKDAYFSMTPERVSYRLAVWGREHFLLWKDVQALQVTKHWVSFILHNGEIKKLRLGLIQNPEIAHHVSRSIHLAALEKGLPVNDVLPSAPEPSLQV